MMTPAQDRKIRAKARQVYEWATRELKETEVPYPQHITGESYESFKARLDERERQMLPFREYRSWLHDLQYVAENRSRHPIVRLIRRTRHIGRIDQYYTDKEWTELQKKIGDGPLHLDREREPTWWFRWWWIDDTEDYTSRRSEAPQIPLFGHTITSLGLPDLKHSGRAWFYFNRDKFQWDINWGFLTHEHYLSVGIDVSGEDGDLVAHVRIPLLGFFFLSFKRAIPVKWLPKHRSTYTTYEPHVFKSQEDHEYHVNNNLIKPVHHEFVQGKDINLGFSIAGDHISWEFFNVSEHMQCDGLRRGYIFWPDKIWGRAVCTVEKNGPPVKAIACLPEGKYVLKLQREKRIWKRPHWPWSYWQKYVDIEAERPPEFQGKGENSYDQGPDAIYGMSSQGWSYEDAVAEYIKATLKERARRGHLNPEHRTIITEELSHV